MFLSLKHHRVELRMHEATALCLIEFPFVVKRLYLQNGEGRYQRIICSDRGDLTQHITAPDSLMRGVIRMRAVGDDIEQSWDAEFRAGTLSIRVPYFTMKQPDEASEYIWIGLWNGLYEDPNQLTLPFDVEAGSRFDHIG